MKPLINNILVTGGAGFIGSSLIDYLLNFNYKIICLDNFDNYYNANIKKNNLAKASKSSSFELIESDIRDSNALRKIFSTHKIDLVIHLAAKAGVRPSLLTPNLCYDVNLNGTLALLEAMKLNSVNKMIFASSSSVYGNNIKIPFSEIDNVDKPISPYAASKKAGELLCHTYHHLYNFDIFCLRFFTVYGPRQRPDLAIYKFMRLMMEEKPISLYGNGNTRRDYTFIDDIIQGIVASIDQIKGYEIINLGESKTISLIDLVRSLEKITGKKAIIEWQPMQPGDVQQTYADISKAKGLLNYNPKTNLEEGLLKQFIWFLHKYEK